MMKRAILCVLAVLALGATALASPSFEYLGYTEANVGVYVHNFKVSNIGGVVPIYDVECTWQYYGGYWSVEGPNDWSLSSQGAANYWFHTDMAPCDVNTDLYGFHIFAGTPEVEQGYWGTTDVNHDTVTSGSTYYPTPEPGCLALLALGGLAMFRRRRRA